MVVLLDVDCRSLLLGVECDGLLLGVEGGSLLLGLECGSLLLGVQDGRLVLKRLAHGDERSSFDVLYVYGLGSRRSYPMVLYDFNCRHNRHWFEFLLKPAKFRC